MLCGHRRTPPYFPKSSHPCGGPQTKSIHPWGGGHLLLRSHHCGHLLLRRHQKRRSHQKRRTKRVGVVKSRKECPGAGRCSHTAPAVCFVAETKLRSECHSRQAFASCVQLANHVQQPTSQKPVQLPVQLTRQPSGAPVALFVLGLVSHRSIQNAGASVVSSKY